MGELQSNKMLTLRSLSGNHSNRYITGKYRGRRILTHSVLVVEDDDSIVEALNFLMETAGFTVRIARDGLEAIDMAKQSVPDLMILDVMLPGCDGFEVARDVRARNNSKDIPILMLTAKNRPIDQEKAMELGVNAFMTKPFSTREVVEKVKQMLNTADS